MLKAWLKYQQAHVGSYIHRSKEYFVNKSLKLGLGQESFLSFLDRTHPGLHEERKKRLFYLSQRLPNTIVFTFRTLHFIDWFAPIHLALERLFPGKFGVIYLDYATTLRRIGSGLEYLRYREQVQSRLLSMGIDPLNHFSHEELSSYQIRPKWILGITTETIRQENLDIPIRVYLPHYCLPKTIDYSLPKNIDFQHVLLPTRPPYTYESLNSNTTSFKFELHHVGYPKELLRVPQIKCFPNSNKPVVIYAPSLEIRLLMDTIKNGIIDFFRNNTQWNFVVKLHPSLESRRHYISTYIKDELSGYNHISVDALSNINSLNDEVSVLITDFGSTGGEFSLKSGKRVIFLQIPKRFEGGADLKFRDDYADAVCPISELPQMLEKLISLGPLSNEELTRMRTKVLNCTAKSDEQAAKTLNQLILNLN